MAALDTNVVIRLMTGDDARQARAAEKLVASEPCTVAMSVLMECEWVLRACYNLHSTDIETCMRDFLRLQNISAADGGLAQHVLDAYASGMDFADALHVAQCPLGERFVTFDKLLVRGASKTGLLGVALLKA